MILTTVNAINCVKSYSLQNISHSCPGVKRCQEGENAHFRRTGRCKVLRQDKCGRVEKQVEVLKRKQEWSSV